jgi:hypothetical protein
MSLTSTVTNEDEQEINSTSTPLSATNFICRACLAEGDKDFQVILEKNLNSFFTDLTRIEVNKFNMWLSE